MKESKMARRTFFSFHYERDVWRAGQVRNCWVTKPDRESAGFWDAAAWEEVKRKGEDAIHRWIDNQLNGTSVTVVLIGAETAERKYVGYEIQQSHKKGNGMLGIYIHNMKDSNGRTDIRGANPFANWSIPQNGRKVLLSEIYPTYDWVNDNGRDNIGGWIETAAKRAGK
jgi:hypothetical protein